MQLATIAPPVAGQRLPDAKPPQAARPAAAAVPAEQYYAGVANLHGEDLVKGVQALLERTYQPMGYNSARDFMFQKLDRAEGGMVDLYSGDTLKGVTSRSQANAQHVNTEHVWPQSQGATGPAKSDLQHLGATTQLVNQYRWHLPFGAVQDAQDGAAPYKIDPGSGSVGFDATGRLVFEPRDEIKGAIARKLMYVHAHYGEDDTRPQDYDERNFTDSLPTLLAWNAAHLPDAAELRRNDVVAGAVGVRNVFVDHPEWATEMMTGEATTPAPRPREEQVEEWAGFLRDPSGRNEDPTS